jgi:hypothetical protein
MKIKRKLGLEQILKLIKSGLNPSQICKKYNIPKQTLDYSVGKLKKQGCIEKIGYGTWKYIKPLNKSENLTIRHSDKSIKNIGTSIKKKREIRGHAFIWKIEFVEPYNWDRIIQRYNKKKLKFQYMKHNKQFRIIFENRKIWLGKRGLTIYEPFDFLGRSSYEVKGTAIYEMDLLIKKLIRELNQKFKPYRFTTSREHYGIIKNELARQYNERKEKMHIRSEEGKIWMWIDDSLSLGELENNQANISRQVQNYWNNHKKHNFKHTGDYIDENFKESARQIGVLTNQTKQNAKNLGNYAKHLKSHVDSIKQLGTNVNVQTEILNDQSKFLKLVLERLEKLER